MAHSPEGPGPAGPGKTLRVPWAFFTPATPRKTPYEGHGVTGLILQTQKLNIKEETGPQTEPGPVPAEDCTI